MVNITKGDQNEGNKRQMGHHVEYRMVKKRRLEIMSNIRNAEWDIMSNSKKMQSHFKKN